jgi:hypothetical protein
MGLPPPKPPPPHECSYTVVDNSKLWGKRKPSQQRRRKTSLSISLKIRCRIVKQAANDPSRQKSQQPKTLHQNEHVPATQLPTLTTVSPKPQTGNKRKNNKNNTCLETTENCQKQKQKLLQHNTAHLIFWVVPTRLETLLESKHPTKGKTFYTLNPKQQTNKTQPKSEKLITKATKTTLTPTAMEERLMSKYIVGY